MRLVAYTVRYVCTSSPGLSVYYHHTCLSILRSANNLIPFNTMDQRTRPLPTRLQLLNAIYDRPATSDGTGAADQDHASSTSDAASIDLASPNVNIPPDLQAIACTERAAWAPDSDSYFPREGMKHLRDVVARHVSTMSGMTYTAEENCVITTGGSTGILNVLFATVEEGDEVITTEPVSKEAISRIALAGATPITIPFIFQAGREWKLDRASLRDAISSRTRVMLLMSPAMPSGAALDKEDWELVAELCTKNDLLLVLDSSMERLLFDGRDAAELHPARLPGMAQRTVIVGSASKELRLIGWRVGWIVAPKLLLRDISTVCLANGATPVGISQEAVAVALYRSAFTIQEYVNELQARRDCLVRQLKDLPIGVPAGGWSLLIRVSDLGMVSTTARQRLLQEGVRVAPVENASLDPQEQYVQLIFSNEPVSRLEGIGEKIRRAFAVKQE